jgi:hypothetical protein
VTGTRERERRHLLESRFGHQHLCRSARTLQGTCCPEHRLRCRLTSSHTRNSDSCMEVIDGKKGQGGWNSRGTAAG